MPWAMAVSAAIPASGLVITTAVASPQLSAAMASRTLRDEQVAQSPAAMTSAE